MLYFFIPFIVVAQLLLISASVPAFEKTIEIGSETILRTYERQDNQGEDTGLFPVYEYLTVDYGVPLENGFTFHAQGWGRADVSGSNYFDDNNDGELLYGYIGYRFNSGGPYFKAGRQNIFTGIKSERVDGLSLEAPVTKWIDFSAYAGLPSVDGAYGEQRDRQMYGTRMGFNLGFLYPGVSYQTIVNPDHEDDENLNIDLYAILPGDVIFSGLSSLNLVSNEWAEHVYELQFGIRNFWFKTNYQRVQFQDFFGEAQYQSSPFRFLRETDDVLTVAGGDVSWQHLPFEVGLRIDNYSYEKQTGTNIYSAGFFHWTIQKNTEFSLECGLMDGEDPENSFILGRTGFKMNALPFLSSNNHLSGDIIYINYDEPIYEENNSISVILSYSRRLFKNLCRLVISGDYSKGPYFNKDVGASVILIYDGGTDLFGIVQ